MSLIMLSSWKFLALLGCLTFGMGCCFGPSSPGGEYLCHYCPNCGIRLVTLVVYIGKIISSKYVFPKGESLVTVGVQNQASTASGEESAGTKIAPSPLGPPPTAVDPDALSTFAGRFLQSQRYRTMCVDWDLRDVPSNFLSADGSSKLYDVSFPDFDPTTKFHASFFWPGHFAATGVVECVWDRRHASIAVTNCNSGLPGFVQLAQQSWDIMFHLPQAEIAEGQEGTDGESNSRLCTIEHADEFTWSCPHFGWMSSEGPLLWTQRNLADAEDQPSKGNKTGSRFRFVLLDGYDRLISAEDEKPHRAAPRKRGRAEEPMMRSKLHFYMDLSEKLTDEVIMSYVALYSQLKRKEDWDSIWVAENTFAT